MLDAEMPQLDLPSGVEIRGVLPPRAAEVLTHDALALVADLVRRFRPRVEQLLEGRRELQRRYDAGERPGFLSATEEIRAGDWTVAPLPQDLQDRRVEITGPVHREVIVNALNSGANVFLADLEDSSSPTWRNVVEGQVNLRDAVEGSIDYAAPDTKKRQRLRNRTAVLMVRPRGWHLVEKHVLVDGKPVTAALWDVGVFLQGNAARLLARGTGPYLCCSKLESHLEARVWNEVFTFVEERLGLPRAAIKATCLVETLPAAFEMNEILWELRERSAGLGFSRWDYVASTIKRLRGDPKHIMPDRSHVTMDEGFLRACVQLLIQTCHRRNVHAIGGMAAQIPLEDARGRTSRRSRRCAPTRSARWPTGTTAPGSRTRASSRSRRRSSTSSCRRRTRCTASARRSTSPPATCSRSPEGRAPRRVSATTCGSPSSTSRRGSAAPAASRSTASRRTPRRWRAPAPSRGSGSTTARRSTTAPPSPSSGSARCSPTRWSVSSSRSATPRSRAAASRRRARSSSGSARRRSSSSSSRSPGTSCSRPRARSGRGSSRAGRAPGPSPRPAAPRSPSLGGHRPPLHPGGRREAAWLGSDRAHARADGRHPAVGAPPLEPYVHALGALTGSQAVQMVKAGLKAIYLSGWQVAADANTAAQTYPDQSLYPANSVPEVVRRINRALQRADQIEHAEGKDGTYWFAPIVADAEAGFGGPLNAFELMKAMIEAGAAGVHFEDQVASEKKCGHLGGKVLVPTSTFVRTLAAARLAADVMGVPTILIARTDAEGAKLVMSDVDPYDAPFIERRAHAGGLLPDDTRGRDRDRARLAYAPYADVIWCETQTPDLQEARRFAEGIHAKFPGKLLAYNCSPSFNWKKHLDDATIATFQRELGAMGYKFQFVTLAGFHALNHAMFQLARGYRDRGMAGVHRAAAGRVRGGAARLHRDAPPARGRHRILRLGRHRRVRRHRVDAGARGLDRGRAVHRRRPDRRDPRRRAGPGGAARGPRADRVPPRPARGRERPERHQRGPGGARAAPHRALRARGAPEGLLRAPQRHLARVPRAGDADDRGAPRAPAYAPAAPRSHEGPGDSLDLAALTADLGGRIRDHEAREMRLAQALR